MDTALPKEEAIKLWNDTNDTLYIKTMNFQWYISMSFWGVKLQYEENLMPRQGSVLKSAF